MPSKDFEKAKKIIDYLLEVKKDVTFMKISNKFNYSLKTIYMLAQQIVYLTTVEKKPTITYKKGKFIYNGG